MTERATIFQCIIVIGSLMLLMSSCTYRVDHLPRPDEFAAPPAILIKEYPDLDPIFPDYSTTNRGGMAYADEFVAAWGEPFRKELSWWYLWPGNLLFLPQYLWSWRLADKEVQCRIDHPIYRAFTPTVCNCRFLNSN